MSVIKSLLDIEAFFQEIHSFNPEHKAVNLRLNELLEEADKYVPRKEKSFFSDRVSDSVSDLSLQLSKDAFDKGFSTAVQLIIESVKHPTK